MRQMQEFASSTNWPDEDLNENVTLVNQTSQDKWVCFKDSKNVLHEILKIRPKNLPARQHSQCSPPGPNWLRCLAGRFYAQISRILKRIYLESLKQTHSYCVGLIYTVAYILLCNFILAYNLQSLAIKFAVLISVIRKLAVVFIPVEIQEFV